MEKEFVKGFFVKSFLLLFIVAAIVVAADPFFHYHKPIKPLKAIVELPEYQCIGTIQNFDYDSIILGSSVAENYNNVMFDNAFGCKSIKGIQKSASARDLMYYLKLAYQNHSLKYVFYSLDLFSLTSLEEHLFDSSKPLYLYNSNPLDDIKYVWNKDVVFEKIPYMVAQSMSGYEEGLSYNWAKYKSFSENIALTNYARTESILPDVISKEKTACVDENLDELVQIIRRHPETDFYFILPPYSLLWWDDICRKGEKSLYLSVLEKSFDNLLSCNNVKIYFFQSERDIVCNLNLYMDPIHFSGAINDWIVAQLNLEQYVVTRENCSEKMWEINRLVNEIENGDVYQFDE